MEQIFDEYRELTRTRDLDITGVTYSLLRESSAGVQWPFPEGANTAPPRLFEDRRFGTPDGRARFHVPQHRAPDDELTDGYPLALLTGRVKDQWHTMTRTGKVRKLNRSERKPFLEIHPDDAAMLGVRDRQLVRVGSRRGSFEVAARVTKSIRQGTLFTPFHWGALWNRKAVANASTSDVVDARSKQPELKFAAVRLESLTA